jgi:hypothetical protein
MHQAGSRVDYKGKPGRHLKSTTKYYIAKTVFVSASTLEAPLIINIIRDEVLDLLVVFVSANTLEHNE